MLLSVGIETAQLCFHLGRCEVDDVIMNTLGASIGAGAYVLAGKKWSLNEKVCVIQGS